MDLSLRDLAERSGVSAPMLSQVERGETSPTLTSPARIAAGLELRLSQLLRLDEGGTVSVVRPADRRSGGADGHRWEVLTPPLPGQRAEVSCHTLQPGARTGGPGDPPMHEPGARETSLVQRGRAHLRLRRRPPRARRRRLRDLRRRPSPPLREPRRGGSGPARRRVGRAAPLMSQTLFDRIWALHEVSDGLLYIDLHLVHEVTSPQAFDGLRLAGRPVRRPDRTLATADHNVPTDGTPVAARIRDELCRVQVETLERNCEEFGIPLYSMGSDRQGIVHVIGPELGVTQPGMTIVCGDSHTATHGAFGALAFGIGTSEVEHVLATQCLAQRKPKSMRIRYEGEPGFGVTAKDLILGTIGQMGTNGAAGHVVEYAGPAIEALSMEGRMTICNMTIEGGGRAGHDRPRRHDVRVDRGPPRRAGGLRRRRRALARAAHRRRRDLRPRDHRRRRRAVAARHLGDDPGDGRAGHRAGARPAVRRRRARAQVHGPRGRDADAGHPPRPRLHRLVHELAHRRPARRRRASSRAARSPPTSTPWSSPARSPWPPRPRRRGSTRSSAPPASTGAPPAARCAWA